MKETMNLKAEIIRLKKEIKRYRALKLNTDYPTYHIEHVGALKAEIGELRQQDHAFRNAIQAELSGLDLRALNAEAELAELRDAVAWMIEVRSLIKDCESYSPMSARLSVSWVGMEEMYELLDKAEVELRRLVGGEDETYLGKG